MKTIAIICPVYNEEDNICNFYNKFSEEIKKNQLQKKYNFFFIFSDNQSTDNSKKIIRELAKKFSNVGMIFFSRNFGVMKSIFTSIRCLESNVDACLIFDCDLQDPTYLLNEFIIKWEEGNKIVYGVREKRIEKRTLKYLRNIFKKIDLVFRGYKVEIESGAWLLDRVIIEQFKKANFDQYLPGLVSRFGFKSASVKYNRLERKKGKTKFNISDYLSYALDGIFNGSIAPLRISIIFCFVFSLSFFISSCYFLIAKFFLKIKFDEGIAAIAVISLFGFAIIFFVLSIICEYIGKIYQSKFEQNEAIIEEINI